MTKAQFERCAAEFRRAVEEHIETISRADFSAGLRQELLEFHLGGARPRWNLNFPPSIYPNFTERTPVYQRTVVLLDWFRHAESWPCLILGDFKQHLKNLRAACREAERRQCGD